MSLPAGVTGTVATTTTVTYSTTYTQAYLPKDDPYLINRLVGFLEYSKALENFDQLQGIARFDEMQAIDEIIKSEPEFTVFINLSRRLEKGRSSLAEKPNGPNDVFSRKGFFWVTALARVEIGAMLAGFTDHPNPFAAVIGNGYDIVEFKEMLIDGAKLHFWSLANDPDFADVTKVFKPNGQTLTYVRRLNVATAFVYAAAGLTGLELNPVQKEEVATYAKNLDDTRTLLQTAIQVYVSTIQANTRLKGGNTKAGELLELCQNGACKQFGNNANGGAAPAAGGGAPKK